MFLRLNPALKARSPQDERRHIDRNNLNGSLNPLRNAPRRPARLASLYPDVSLTSPYSNRLQENNDSYLRTFNNRDALASDGKGLSTSQQTGDPNCQNIDRLSASRLRVKGTPLVLGASAVLRASAAAVGVGSDAANTAVEDVEENIETVESEVSLCGFVYCYYC